VVHLPRGVGISQAAGLEQMLSDSMLNGTFFVPTDTAFTEAKTWDGMPISALLKNPPLLAQVR
jgi:Fasciclin domain